MPSVEKLTDKFVRSVRTSLRQEEFWDASRPGFFLRVTRGGVRRFFYAYREPGEAPARARRKRALALGLFNPDDPDEGRRFTLADGISAWRVASGKVADGVDPQGKNRKERGGTQQVPLLAGVPEEKHARAREIFGVEHLVPGSFGELARDYLVFHAWPEKRRTLDDEHMLRRDLLPHWRDRPASSITRRDVVELTDRIIAVRHARVMANHVRLLISRIYNFGISRVRVEHNPAHLVKISGGKGRPGQRWLSDEEIRTLWFGVERSESPVFRAQIRVLLVLFQRPGEIGAMEASELKEDGWWLLPGEKVIPYAGRKLVVGTKNKLPHAVYLPGLARQEIATIREAYGGRFVFPTAKRQDQPLMNLRKSLCRLAEDLGMAHFTPHDLRRTGTTNLQRLGVPDEVIDAVVNHVPRGVRRHYNLWHHREQRRDAMLRWEAHLKESILKPLPV
jgi:integrase